MINKKRNPVERSSRGVGEAYAFFDCSASKEVIEEKLPDILTECSPGGLEVSLMEVKDFEKKGGVGSDLLHFIRERKISAIYPSEYLPLMRTAKPTKMTFLKYVMRATLPTARNDEVADKLGSVMNQVRLLWGDGKPYNMAIVYKIDGEYYFQD